MLAVRKPTLGPDGKVDIRISLDPKYLNGAIKREHFPMPTIEEVATRLNGAKIFSVFDASNWIWQVELDQASSRFSTFNTPFGRLHGVEVIADDFVVVGFGSTPEEWNAEHDRNVRAFLERCREKNLNLKKEKAQLTKTEVSFIEHILTPNGLRPDSKKVEAINDMTHPTDVQSLQMFLVLRRLTEKAAELCWLTAHEEAVVRIQKMISAAPVLAYYDVTKPVTIQCDAYSNGKVENAVNTCKLLLKKARDDKPDPLLGILWRNTPTEGMGASPAQLLYGRRTRTRLPVAKKQLKSTLIE
ncbi:Hypothetical predicted protein [Paramuricea clavata]|uniref:Uncharacterized protein n=1 Tax=Paramuricea clavata TaxID=317549 RepID=A0A7D9J4S7_PARCT|nr:Hypothetical predicted protein [Paramuricea clavata]